MASFDDKDQSRVDLHVLADRDLLINDLADVFGKLYDARDKWFEIGLALQVDYPTLKSTEKEQHKNQSDCLREMLAHCIESKKLTWRKLLQALKHPTVGREALATQILHGEDLKDSASDSDSISSTHSQVQFCPSIIEGLQQQSEEIVIKFEKLSSSIRESLINRNIKDRLVAWLMSLKCFSKVSGKHTNELRFREQRRKLKDSSATMDTIWSTIEESISFFDYELLEIMVYSLGTDQDKEDLAKYKEEFCEYGERRLIMSSLSQIECSPIRSCAKDVHVVLSSSFVGCKIISVKSLQRRLSKVLNLKQGVLCLHKVELSSLLLVFELRNSIFELVFPLPANKEAFLLKLGIIQIDCGDYHFEAKPSIIKINEFINSIKMKYTEKLLHCEEQWPPVSVEKLVKLQLVEAEKKEGFRAGLPQYGAYEEDVKRTLMLYADLFKVEEGKKRVRKLIIEGNAGIGKTTLCTMLAEQWANGEIFTQFDCVLLLPLRERSVSTATTLPQLLKLLHSSEKIRSSVIEELEEREGEDVLIIADGWDELDQENRTEDSFLHNLLFGKILTFVSVVLTSRPSASAPLHDLPTVDRLVEVVGFNEENIKQYIKSEFEKCPKKASSLIEQIENNPVIQSVCSVPLNCAIICHLWHTLDRALPKTLTELYVRITLNVILREERKKHSTSLILTSFDSIPENLQDMFWSTCKFAFECLTNNQIVFSEDEVLQYFPEIAYKISCLYPGTLASSSLALTSMIPKIGLGLLQCAQSLLPVGFGLSFHFAHLTIQEFLAALHLVTLPNEVKLKVCKAHANSHRYEMVWRFMFGLGSRRESVYSRRIVCLDDEVVERFLNATKGAGMVCLPMLCHCSMESINDSNLSLKIANKNRNAYGELSVSKRDNVRTPYDCLAIFHVMRLLSHCTDARLELDNCGLTDNLLKELTDILCDGTYQVKALSLSDNRLTGKGITDLLSRASTFFSSLESLSLEDNSITNIIIPYDNSITVINLSNNPLGVSGIQQLETAIEAGVLVRLERLVLSNTLTLDADINGALLASFLPTLASHCPRLKGLELSKNKLGVPGASAIDQLITNLLCRKQLYLNLSDTGINAEAVTEFVNTRYPCTLGLLLCDNPLRYDGLLAVFRMLRNEFCSITDLFLRRTDLTTTVNIESQHNNAELEIPNTIDIIMPSLGPVIENIALTSLELSGNNFAQDRVFILADCMRVCKSLIHLLCTNCSLTSSEVCKILFHLKSHKTILRHLLTLNLSYNSIDNEGVSALMESLPELFPSLESIPLDGNPGSVSEVKNQWSITNDYFWEVSQKIREMALEKQKKISKRCLVLIEWDSTGLPPQDKELLEEFNEMWRILMEHIVWEFQYQIRYKLMTRSARIVPTEDTTREHSLFLSKRIDRQRANYNFEFSEDTESTSETNVTTPFLATPHAILEVHEPKTVTIEELKARTKVTDSQLDSEIQESDMISIAALFNNVETLSVQLRLSPADRQDAKDMAFQFDVQTGVDKALRLWRKANPAAATYRALVEIALRMGPEVKYYGKASAERICKFLANS